MSHDSHVDHQSQAEDGDDADGGGVGQDEEEENKDPEDVQHVVRDVVERSLHIRIRSSLLLGHNTPAMPHTDVPRRRAGAGFRRRNLLRSGMGGKAGASRHVVTKVTVAVTATHTMSHT